MAATRTFITSISNVLQTSLAPKIKKKQVTVTSPTPTILRWSRRLAKTDALPNVRSSKKGEVQLMCKLGVIALSALITAEAQKAYAVLFDKLLSMIHLETIRDLFLAAQALSGGDLNAALAHMGEQASAS